MSVQAAEVAAMPSIEQIAADMAAGKGEQAPPPDEEGVPPVDEQAPGPSDETPPPPPVVEQPKEVKRPDPQAAKFAALSRREREIRQREAEADRKRQEAEDRFRAAEERQQKVQTAKTPVAALRALGFTTEEFTQDLLGNFKEKEPDPMDVKLQEKLTPLEEQLKKYQETIQKQQETLEAIQSERAEAARRDVRRQIVDTAEKQGCEYISAIGEEAYALVGDVITEYWNQNKKLLNFEEACGRVEAYYLSQFDRLASTAKGKSRFAPPAQPAPPTPAPSKEKRSDERPNTLTQAHSAATRATKKIDDLPKHEALAELAKQIRFIK